MDLKIRRPLAAIMAAALGLMLIAPMAQAQIDTHSSRRRPKAEQAEKPAMYPNATRKQPEAQATPKAVKVLQDMQKLYEKEDWAGVIAKASEVEGMSKANAYDKAFAYSMAGNAESSQDNQAKAAEYFAKAIATDGLDNDAHYSTMYNLAAIQFGEEKYTEALATLDRFLAETKSDKPEQLSFRAGILANLGRNDEAAAAYSELLAKNPTDKRILMNAVAALQGADKFDQANVLLEDAYKRGLLTEQRELRALYVGYMNAERWTDAQKVMEDGEAKGILKAGPDLGRDYQVLAQNAYVDDKIPLAITLYQRAAPMAADGEAYLNLAKVLDYAGKDAEAKVAAKTALEKGVAKPDEAKRILSR